MFFCEEDRVLF